MRNVLLTATQSPGDILMLTGAVRDLHLAHPKEFATEVNTTAMQIWENNPYAQRLQKGKKEVVVCEYPLVHQSNQLPRHFCEGYHGHLAEKLGVSIPITASHGDIHISDQEKAWFSRIRELTGMDMPFWIIVAGGKMDFTAKWWIQERWQDVVDAFHSKILFVQCGELGPNHNHQPLKRVIDLRGKTDTRQFIRLVYHSQGVLCPVTFAMHLAAAVPTKDKPPINRPCVVIAGGREPTAWEAYPHHRFLNTNGALPCCDNGGCWKSRTVPLGDGDEKDRSLCVSLVESGSSKVQKCMDMITVEDVVRAIRMYFDGGVCRYLTPEEFAAAEKHLT